MKSKIREPWYLAKMDTRVKNKVNRKAKEMGISSWLLIEHLLDQAVDGKNTSKQITTPKRSSIALS